MEKNDTNMNSPDESIRGSVAALLSNIIDYAGLFPPAELDMDSTVRNYAAYLAGEDAWMLERLILPTSRLADFQQHSLPLIAQAPERGPWEIAALTAPAGAAGLAADLERIAHFNAEQAGAAVIELVELKADSSHAIDDAIEMLPDGLFPFFEIPASGDPRGMIAALVGGEAGAKIRTGGVTAEFYPRSEHIARFIAACASADVPFKATAGLHHPLTHHPEAVGATEFGFLNLFIAAALARTLDVEEDELAEVLAEGSPDAFRFDDDGLRWRDCRLTNEQIEDARLSFAVSFGSCSFDEPLADLRALGLL